MSEPARRATDAYRKRLARDGLSRFEVVGHEGDKQLLRQVARRLAAGDGEAEALRRLLQGGAAAPRRGGLLRALRDSPMVGAELDLARVEAEPRDGFA